MKNIINRICNLLVCDYSLTLIAFTCGVIIVVIVVDLFGIGLGWWR